MVLYDIIATVPVEEHKTASGIGRVVSRSCPGGFSRIGIVPGPNRIENIPVLKTIIKFLGSSGMEPGWSQDDARIWSENMISLISVSVIMLSAYDCCCQNWLHYHTLTSNM